MTFLFHESVVTSFSSWACRVLIIYSLIDYAYSNQLFWISRYFKLKPISLRLGFALRSFTIGYFELPLFQTFFVSPDGSK